MKQDETNKKSFIRFIEEHVNFVSAVLLVDLVDLVSQNTFKADYTWSNLTTIFPKTLVNNIAFLFINVQSSLFPDRFQNSIPGALKSSPVFLLDNPIVQQWRFKDREQGALEMFVEFFNWMDGLEPQPATEITSLYEVYQNIEVKTTSILYQRAREVEIDRLTVALKRYSAVSLSLRSHLALESYSYWM